MSRYITDEQAGKWQLLSDKLRQVAELVAECQRIILLDMVERPGFPQATVQAMVALDKLESASKGMAYMFHPQTEWVGGDSSNPNNHKQTLPHIARY